MPFYTNERDATNFAVAYFPDAKGAFGMYCKGYTLAASRLASTLIKAPRFSDYEAYPVVFLYRHALELSLKHIIYNSIDLALLHGCQGVETALQNTHDLERLGSAASILLIGLYPEDALVREVLSDLLPICKDFAVIDKHSDAYRYPLNRSGGPSAEEHQTVNLRALSQHLSDLLEKMDTIHFGQRAEREAALEALSMVRG